MQVANSVELSGTISGEIERRKTSSGSPIASFRISVPSRDGYYSFRVIAFGGLATEILGSFEATSPIRIVGELTQRSYTAKGGATVETVEILAKSISGP